MENMETHRPNGFTLIEIIAVLLIMSIGITVVVSRMTETNDNELTGQIEVIKSHLGHAQSKAMSMSSTSSFWYIHFETAPARYTLYNKDDVSTLFLGEPNITIALKSGMSLSGGTYIRFDNLGRPYTGTPGTQLTTVKTIITSSVGNIEIKPETGFIP